MGEIQWLVLISILHRWVQYSGCGLDRPLGSRNGPSAIGPQLFGSSAVVWYVRCLDYFNWTLWVRFHGWYWYQSFMYGSNIWGVGRTDPWWARNGPSTIGPQLFGSSAVVWYVRCLDSLNWTLWVRFHGWYWYQSFIDGSNFWVCGKDRPCSYLVEVPSYDISVSLILLTGIMGEIQWLVLISILHRWVQYFGCE